MRNAGTVRGLISHTLSESLTRPDFTAEGQRSKGRRDFVFILRTLCLFAAKTRVRNAGYFSSETTD